MPEKEPKITPEIPPKEEGQRKEIETFVFKGNMTVKEILAEMKKRGLRPVELSELSLENLPPEQMAELRLQSEKLGIKLEEKQEKKEPQILEGIVFKKVKRPDGKIEYRSSDPERKIAILAPGSVFEPEEDKLYDVEVVEDTDPDNPLKGKLIVKAPVLEEVPIVEKKLTAARLLAPVEVDEDRGEVYVLETVLPLNREGGPLVPKPEKFQYFALDKRTLETLEKVATGVELREPVMLEGETAASKTSSIEYLAMKTGNEVLRLNLNGQTDTSELIGKYVPNEGQLQIKFEEALRNPELLTEQSRKILTQANKEGRGLSIVESQKIAHAEGLKVSDWRWQDGADIRAKKEGKWLILDEINLAEDPILERLNSQLEKSPSIAVSEHEGEIIRELDEEEMELYKQGKLPNVVPLHPNFRILSTMNPAEYTGRKPMSPAYKNRWLSYQFVKPPTQQEYQDMMRLMVYGEQPVVEVGREGKKKKYGGEKIEPAFKVLESMPGFNEFIAKMAKFQTTIENLARNREIGKNKKEKYIFTRRDLIEFLEYLEKKTIVDRETRKKLSIKDNPKEIILRSLQYYYLDKIANPEDLQKVQDQMDIIKISEKKWDVKLGAEAVGGGALKEAEKEGGKERTGKFVVGERVRAKEGGGHPGQNATIIKLLPVIQKAGEQPRYRYQVDYDGHKHDEPEEELEKL